MFVGKGRMSMFADNPNMSTFADNPNMSTYVDFDTNVACLAAKSVDRDARGRGHLSCSKGPSVEPGTARPRADVRRYLEGFSGPCYWGMSGRREKKVIARVTRQLGRCSRWMSVEGPLRRAPEAIR
jgi:hypothetical protein